MQVDVSSRPAYALAYVKLTDGESVFCESGSMVAISGGMEAGAAVPGGIVRSAFRRALTQESFVMTRFTAHIFGAWVALAPRYPGDIASMEVRAGEEMIIQSGALLAHSQHLEVKASAGSFQTLLMSEGIAVLKTQGEGTLVICSYGGLERFQLHPGETLVVDTGHLVAWSAAMGIRVGPLKGLVSSQLTGEGLVAEFTGPGVVYVQTRAEQQLRSWLMPERSQNGT